MGKAIIVGLTIILLAITIAVVTIWWRKRDMDQLAAEKGTRLKGDLGPKEERELINQLRRAETIMSMLLDSCDPHINGVDNITVMSPLMQEMLRSWIRNTQSMEGRT